MASGQVQAVCVSWRDVNAAPARAELLCTGPTGLSTCSTVQSLSDRLAVSSLTQNGDVSD